MEVIVNHKKYLGNSSKTGEVDIPNEFGEIYHFALKNKDEMVSEMDFYFECYDRTVELKKFRANDKDSAKAIFLALRYFCFINETMLIESDDLSERNGKKEFENFIDGLNDDNLSIDGSSESGYSICLFDEEESFHDITASFTEKKYTQNNFHFNIKEFD